MPDITDPLREAIGATGLTPPKKIIADGKKHRFSSNGKRGDDAGWYICYLNGGILVGRFGDFRTGISQSWRADLDRPLSPAEKAAHCVRMKAMRQKRKAEEDQRRAEAVSKAKAIWQAAQPAADYHPYLIRKGVKATATLRKLHADRVAEILGYRPRARGEVLAGRILVAPIKIGDKLSSMEFIDERGRKSAIAGGAKRGGYWAGQPLPEGKGAGQVLLIGEGIATVISASEATGHKVIAALSANNLPAVARTLRERYPVAALIILADVVKKTGAPEPSAIEAARAVGGGLAVPDFGPDRAEGDTDFNDLAQRQGPEAVRRAIENATVPSEEKAPSGDSAAQPLEEDATRESQEQFLARLAAMTPLDYERSREHEAKALGVRVSALDRLVEAVRQRKVATGPGIKEVAPWPHPVAPAPLLTKIARTVRRFIVCSQETAHAVALWVAMTWFMDEIQVAPLAVITAPEKRCGKSQLLSLMGKLVKRPLISSNISPAALFRCISAWQPTLLVDEADTFVRENEELRGLINCGHTRDTAFVIRVEGEEHTPRRFHAWGAKALAGIGHLHGTLMDRAVLLKLRRKLPHEQVERLRHAEPGLFDDLAAQLARFAEDHRETVAAARPALPESLNDRAQDNWEPLLAIAKVAGPPWPAWAQAAALKLSEADEPSGSIGTELLSDIQEVFERLDVDRISTADLIRELCSDEEKPWATYNRGRFISSRQVASRLKAFGIHSKSIRIKYHTAKGYHRDQFEDAFSRYLSPGGFAENSPYAGEISPVTDNQDVTVTPFPSVTLQPRHAGRCDGVTDNSGEGGEDYREVEI